MEEGSTFRAPASRFPRSESVNDFLSCKLIRYRFPQPTRLRRFLSSSPAAPQLVHFVVEAVAARHFREMAIVAPARHSSPFHGFSHLDERRGSTSTQSSTQESSASHAPYNPRRASKLSEISSNSDKDTQTSCATYGFFSSVHSDVPLLTIQQVGKDTTGWNKGKSLAGDGAAEDLSGSSGGDDSPPLPIKEYALGRNSGSFRREPVSFVVANSGFNV